MRGNAKYTLLNLSPADLQQFMGKKPAYSISWQDLYLWLISVNFMLPLGRWGLYSSAFEKEGIC